MIELGKAVLLGAIQGITEFLPVSSTGHLILAERFLGISQDVYGLSFDAALHLGTLVALLWFFNKEWVELIQAGVQVLRKRSVHSPKEKLFVLLLIATVPGAIFGLLLEKKVETIFRSPLLVAVMLILFSGVLIYVEKMGKKTRLIGDMSRWESLKIGLAQAIALVPGVSRSGITIATGMWAGLTREEAARFAFLLSAPIIAGAGGVKLLETVVKFVKHELPVSEIAFFAIGIVSAAIFGYLTIKYFMRYISNRSLYPFVIYRIVLGIVVIASWFLFK